MEHIAKVILSIATLVLIVLVTIPFKLLMCLWYWQKPMDYVDRDRDYVDLIIDLVSNIYNK
jgi:hypothetical protein